LVHDDDVVPDFALNLEPLAETSFNRNMLDACPE